MKVKSLFKSKQFWWSFFPVIWECYGQLGDWVEKEALTNKDKYELFGVFLYAIGSILFRYFTDSVTFTPPSLPGRNKVDALKIAAPIARNADLPSQDVGY